MRAGATVCRVRGVAIQIGSACALAANGGTIGVVRAPKGSRAVWIKVDRAIGDMTACSVSDAHRKIVTVDEGNVVVVVAIRSRERKFCEGSWKNTRECALQATNAPAVKARIWSWVGTEVAITARPDPTGVPIFRYIKRDGCEGSCGPPSLVIRYGVFISCIQRWPDRERTMIVNRDRASNNAR